MAVSEARRREDLREAGEARGHASSPAPPVGLPPRYGAVVAGSGLLMLAFVAGVLDGPGAASAAREIVAAGALAAGLALLLLASLDVRVPLVWRRLYRRTRLPALAAAFVLALGAQLTLAGTVHTLLDSPAVDSYVTDILSFSAADARLVLAGRNPYTSDWAFRDALARYPYALASPRRGRTFGTGRDQPSVGRVAAVQRRYAADPAPVRDAFDPATLHSYPALSFLLYVPLFWAGASKILALDLVVYWALCAWLVWIAPIGWRHWGALIALAAMPTVAGSLIESDEVICVAFVLAAWHLRGRRWPSAVLLGLGCAYKQYCWFFVPFFLLDVLLDADWREAPRRGAIALGAFLVPNLPFLLASPRAWLASLWLPMGAPLFANGLGLVALSIGHVIPYAPPAVYAPLELAVLVAALWAFARRRRMLREAALMLALLPLFFAFRALSDYFAFAPWLALYAAHRLYGRRAPWSPSPLARIAVGRWRTSGRTVPPAAM